MIWTLKQSPTLRLQRAVDDGKVVLTKVLGTLNPAHMGTKHMEAKIITQTWQKAGFVVLHGRSERALRTASDASGAKTAWGDFRRTRVAPLALDPSVVWPLA